jgi:hypothetical protein
MSVRTVLWVSGLLTLIAVAVPQTVFFGLLLLIIPGLILWFAPTVFLYTATFAIVRRRLPVTRLRAHNLIAAVITLGLGVAVTLPMALPGRLAFHLATKGDVGPHDRVVIAGDVLVNSDRTPTEGRDLNWRVPCYALCAALLDTPGVTSVTLAGTDDRGDAVKPISYRLVPKGEAGSNGVAPTKPEQILQYLPEKRVTGVPEVVIAARKARENAVISHWALRLATEVTLSIVPPPRHHDLTIKMTSAIGQDAHGLAVKQLDVRDRDGRALLRREYATVDVVLVPLALEPYDLLGHPSWGLARTTLHTGDDFAGVETIKVLFDETTLARPPEPGDGAAGERRDDVIGMRDRLAAALLQPGAQPDLALATPWLATLDWFSMKNDDHELLGKLIADARVTDLRPLFGNVRGPVRPVLRGAIIARLINPATSPEMRSGLDDLVRLMAPGTFSVPTPDETALLHDQSMRLNLPHLVERLSDQGQAGVPELVRILQADVRVEPWRKRQRIVEAVCRAFIRLGPDAAGALPAVLELFDQPHPPLADDSSHRSWWRIAMVRMGLPIEEVPFPPQFTAEEIAQGRSDIVRAAERARNHPEWAWDIDQCVR